MNRPADRAQRLVDGLSQYRAGASQHYDEVLEAVSAVAARDGELGKVEIAALVVWKRLTAATPWANALMATADTEVRTITRRARQAAYGSPGGDSDGDLAALARSSLTDLPGFSRGDALASAVLCALAPDRMAVYDQRAHRGLTLLELHLDNRRGRYGRYMRLIHQLQNETLEHLDQTLTVRDVDLALYQLGQSRRGPSID